MTKMTLLFDEFIMKAITMTETIMDSNYRDDKKLAIFTQNRERLLAIIDQISEQIDWASIEMSSREELHRKIDGYLGESTCFSKDRCIRIVTDDSFLYRPIVVRLTKQGTSNA